MPAIKKKIIKKIVKKPIQKTLNSSKNKVPANISSIERMQDSKIKETARLVKQIGIKINYNPKINNPREIEEYFLEEIGNYLNEKYNDIKERVSELIKFGYDGNVWVFKLMIIPLKIKIFLSTGDKKDFNNVTKRLNEILKEIIEFEKKKQETELQKEQIEKIKEQREKQKKDKEDSNNIKK